MDNSKKLAVLIDAENVSSKYVKIILEEALNYGNLIFKRIYGNWTSSLMTGWKDVILDCSIQPIQQYSNTSGKNSSDSALIIDAMDLLYTDRLDGFCIVSSDSDFTRLASRLKESEKFVLGMGETKTPKSFVNACDKFTYIDLLAQEKDDIEQAKSSVEISANKETEDSSQSGRDKENVINTIKKLIEENSDDSGWIFSGVLGNLIMKRYPDFDVRLFGFKKFLPFIQSIGMFDVEVTPSEQNKNVKQVYIRNSVKSKAKH